MGTGKQPRMTHVETLRYIFGIICVFQRPRGRVSLSKSFAGKSIDEKFNSLLDVVMKHGDEINELFKENTRGRRNSQTEVKNSIQG